MPGLSEVPSDRPVMLLPNHQNALLDPLLMAAFAKARRPYFLTRSDVFQGKFLKAVFDTLRMIPIYRLRDGRDTLHKNQAIFDRCAELLSKGEHLLLFPEANHNLQRRVRPLSKGFTRIVLHTLKQYPETDLILLPIGINYQRAAGFPDRVAFVFGKPIPAAELFRAAGDEATASKVMKKAVFEELTRLTTHVPPEQDYQEAIARMGPADPDFMYPGGINDFLQGRAADFPSRPPRSNPGLRSWDVVFRILNFPVLWPWGWIARNKIWEPEFISTFRFCFSLLAFPLYLLILFLGIGAWFGWMEGGCIAGGVFLHNLAYVKFR